MVFLQVRPPLWRHYDSQDYYRIPGTNAGESTYGGSAGYFSCLLRIPLRCCKPLGSTLKWFNQSMWRDGNVGWFATPRVEPFMWFTLVIIAWLTITALPLVIWDTPSPRTGTLGPGGPRGFSLNRTKPPKPRCGASRQGLCGTGVELSQCREWSSLGTRQHTIIYMASTHMECCRWWPLKSLLLLEPLWKPRRQKPVLRT
jgi:hypothetical protein